MTLKLNHGKWQMGFAGPPTPTSVPTISPQPLRITECNAHGPNAIGPPRQLVGTAG
jgi:hypothetical protein